MADLYNNQTIPNVDQYRVQIPDTYQGVANEWYINRTPIFARFPKLLVGSDKFNLIGYNFRPRTVQLNGAIGDTTTTTFVFDDASYLQVGDVLRAPSYGEAFEVQAVNVGGASTTVTVKRGVCGTTKATLADNAVLELIGNSRSGAEVDQAAISQKPATVQQFVQTYQHVVQVGGKVQAMKNYVPTPGRPTPYDQNRMDALTNFMEDVEYSAVYGIGESPDTTSRPKMKGLRELLVTNRVSAPTNAGAYKPTDFIADTLEKILANGGNPDVMLCSSKWTTGLAQWSFPVERQNVGDTVFGQRITTFRCPFLQDLTIIPCPLFKGYDAAIVSSDEIRFRFIRQLDYAMYGKRGDAQEGEWVGDYAIEVDNQQHHAWLENVTGWAVQS